MKKLLLLPALLVIISTVSSAQVKGGLKAGGTLATTRFNDLNIPFYENADFRAGYLMGVWTTFPINNQFTAQPEVLFSLKGWRYTDFITEYTQDYYYLNLPLMVGYKPIPTFTILAGPEFGYLIDGYQVDSTYRRFETGLAAGASYQLLQSLNLDIRYSYGLTNLVKWDIWDDNHQFINYKGGKNRTIQVSLAYQLKAK